MKRLLPRKFNVWVAKSAGFSLDYYDNTQMIEDYKPFHGFACSCCMLSKYCRI